MKPHHRKKALTYYSYIRFTDIKTFHTTGEHTYKSIIIYVQAYALEK